MSGPQIDAAWAAFDTDRNGTLDAKEIEKVVESILTALAVEQHAVHKLMRSMFDEAEKFAAKEVKDASGKDVKAAGGAAAAAAAPKPKKDGHQLSKRVLESLKKKIKGLTRQLLGRLDKNKDGKVDKAEFTVLFPSWFEKIVTEGIRESYF